MKYLLIITMAVCLLLCACNKDANEQLPNDPAGYYLSSEGLMMDGQSIKELELYIIEREITNLSGFNIPAFYTNEYTYKQKEPVFADYSSVKIYAIFEHQGSIFVNDTTFNHLIVDWYNRRTDFILAQYRQRTAPMEWPLFFTSYVNGDVQLTCDKVLFGHQPGEDLSQHFKVTPPYNYLPVGREQPRVQYSFDNRKQLLSGVPMADFFTKDSWMQSAYLIRFIDEPSERYDDLTFTLTFPASLEHVKEFCTSKYKGENAPMKVTDTTYTASFTAKFNWN